MGLALGLMLSPVAAGAAPAMAPADILLALEPDQLTIPLPELLSQSSGSTVAVSDGDPVGRITALAGADLVQPTSGSRPTYGAADGKHRIGCSDGQFIASGVMAGFAQPLVEVHALRLVTLPTGSNYATWVGGGASNECSVYNMGSQLRIFAGAELGGLASPSAGADVVVIATFDGTSSSIAIAGGASQSGDPDVGAWTGMAWGANGDGSSPGAVRLYGSWIKAGASPEDVAAAAAAMLQLLPA